MARLTVVAQDVIGNYPSLPITATDADFVFVASGADFADGFGFANTGKQILVIRNDNAGAQTVTISSVADDKNRTGDITAYSIGIGLYSILGPFPVDGWSQTSKQVHGAVSAADLMIAVLTLDV